MTVRCKLFRFPGTRRSASVCQVKVWKDLMDAYYPGIAWLCLERDAFDRLYQYKVERGIPTWEQALESLLRAAEEEVKS